MLRGIIGTVKIRVVRGHASDGQRVGKKVDLLPEIPFATQQAWRRRRERKESTGSVSHAPERGPLRRPGRQPRELRSPEWAMVAKAVPAQHAQRPVINKRQWETCR